MHHPAHMTMVGDVCHSVVQGKGLIALYAINRALGLVSGYHFSFLRLNLHSPHRNLPTTRGTMCITPRPTHTSACKPGRKAGVLKDGKQHFGSRGRRRRRKGEEAPGKQGFSADWRAVMAQVTEGQKKWLSC